MTTLLNTQGPFFQIISISSWVLKVKEDLPLVRVRTGALTILKLLVRGIGIWISPAQ